MAVTAGAPARTRLLIDELMPEFDARRVDRREVPGDLEAVYAATMRADFLSAWKESRLVRVLFGARELGERTVSALRRRPFEQPPEPEAMRLAEMPSTGDEWVRLGENPPHEIAFGAIGRFWAGETKWETIDASEFAGFDRPGFAKIACNFHLQPGSAGTTLVSYECRTRATDPASRKAFLRYWRPLNPFIGIVLRSVLRVIEREARGG
jgi:hypothetical protein